MGRQIHILFICNSSDSSSGVVDRLAGLGLELVINRIHAKETFTQALAGEAWDIALYDSQCKHLELAEVIESLQVGDSGFPLIVLAEPGQESQAVEAINAGACDYISTDQIERLGSAITREVREYRLSRMLRSSEDHPARKNRVVLGEPILPEYWDTETELARRIKFEKALAEISFRFAGPMPLDEAINESFGDIGKLTGAGRISMLQYSDDYKTMFRLYEWCAEGGESLIDLIPSIPCDAFGWWIDHMKAGKTIEAWDLDLVPVQNKSVKESIRISGAKSVLALPVHASGKLAGFVSLSFLDNSANWTDNDVTVLGIFSGIIGSALERQAAEDAFHTSESRFKAVFESTAIGICISDPDGIILASNNAFRTMLGYQENELDGVDFTKLSHPEDMPPDQVRTNVLGEDRDDHFQIEKRYLAKNGSVVWVRVTISLVRDEAGEPHFIIGMVEDITLRTQVEQELRHAQKMEAVGQLATGIAHDFRNQLTVIKGQSDTLLRRGLVDGKAKSGIEQILIAADRSAALASDLLTFSRKQMLRPEQLDLWDHLVQMQPTLMSILGEGITLSLPAGKDLGDVRIDPGQFDQAMINIASNAKDAMPRGGKVQIDLERIELAQVDGKSHSTLPAGPYMKLTISDTGEGMDHQTRAKVFEPFFSTKAQGKGTGLGLAMVYGFVRQSGGDITVESEVSCGTTFTILLPRLAEMSEKIAQANAPDSIVSGSGTILVVEDDELVSQIIVETLTDAGYAVLQAENATIALALARGYQGTIDLLVTDVVMPGLTGADLARDFISTRPETHVLFVSGYGERDLIERGLLTVGQNLLAKPFSGTELSRAVAQVMHKAKVGSAAKLRPN